MSGPALLDVNVLVALFDPDHVHHDLAHDWFADHRADGWATSPTTENGFVRVLSNPTYGAVVGRPSEIVDRLSRFCTTKGHVFWPDAVSFRDAELFKPEYVRGHRQLTDLYLLGLALRMRGRLATFDRSIPLSGIVGATRSILRVIAPSPDE